jgi:hypothetical protein
MIADPEKAARRLLEHAHAFEPIQDGRIYIEKLNGPFLFGTARAKVTLLAGEAGPHAALAPSTIPNGAISIATRSRK